MEYFQGGNGEFMRNELTPRLYEVSQKIGNTDVLCDVGCDHAYLPIYLINNNRINKAYACDVREGPLEIAKKNIHKNNLDDKIFTVLSDGLDKVRDKEISCISICGMGGNLISRILSDNIECAKRADKIILQPMTEIEVLRKFLYENGFVIYDESLAKEDRRYYNIICAKKGIEEESDVFDFYFGKKLFENPSFLLKEYIQKNHAVFSNVLKQKQKSGRENTQELEYIVSVLYEKLTDFQKKL